MFESDSASAADYWAVALGSRALGDRWTILIVREMLDGTTRYTDILNRVPGLSRSLLSQRLRQLERLDVIHRDPSGSTRGRFDYVLTPSGRALGPLVAAFGEWAARWQVPPSCGESSDVPLLLSRLAKSVIHERVPNGRVSIEFRFADAHVVRGWLHIERSEARVGLGANEHDVDLRVASSPLVMNDLRTGRATCDESIESGAVVFEGAPKLAANFRQWFGRTTAPPGEGHRSPA